MNINYDKEKKDLALDLSTMFLIEELSNPNRDENKILYYIEQRIKIYNDDEGAIKEIFCIEKERLEKKLEVVDQHVYKEDPQIIKESLNLKILKLSQYI